MAALPYEYRTDSWGMGRRMTAWLTVVGIGEDGLDGLGAAARQAVAAARVLVGGERHLALVPERPGQQRQPWPRPFDAGCVLAWRGTPVCVLASGDPMLFGVGATLARLVPPAEMRVLPAPSAFALAAARLGWALQDTALLSVTGRPVVAVLRHAHDGARLLVLSSDGSSPVALAQALAANGFGASRLEVLEHMGGPLEARRGGTAAGWDVPRCADLNVVAIECRADADHRGWPGLAGLPDEAFQHDGQLTKRDMRAVTLAHLAPLPGELLWDVGAGSGSIGIEWMRSHPACRAIAIEAHELRQALIARNRDALGVPGLRIVPGRAPEALAGLPAPDAIFIGGGLTEPGVPERCWEALRPGGRLVANAVTVQTEAMLADLRGRLGGDLVRLSVAHAMPLGRFDTWRTALPVTLWRVRKPL
jgi:precorrin-6B C5,15-methyltransferase / cobalt-precorrin-6B C5,C15-methyltransferase